MFIIWSFKFVLIYIITISNCTNLNLKNWKVCLSSSIVNIFKEIFFSSVSSLFFFVSDTATLSETFITNGLRQIGCQGNIVKEGKQGEGVELCQIMQQLDW